MIWSSLSRPGWTWTHSSHYSALWVLGFQVCNTMPSVQLYYECFASMYLSALRMCLMSSEVRRRGSNALELELETVVRSHMSPGNWTGVLCKNRKCSQPTEPSLQPLALFKYIAQTIFPTHYTGTVFSLLYSCVTLRTIYFQNIFIPIQTLDPLKLPILPFPLNS